jgi:alpha-amylase
VIGVFLDNQDNPRFNSLTSDKSLVYNAIVANFLYGGIPNVYYGLEQDISDGSADPYNREALWLYNDFSTTATATYARIAALNKIRTAMGTRDQSWYGIVAEVADIQDQDIALARGGGLIVLTNVRTIL